MSDITGKELTGPELGKLGKPIMKSGGWTRIWCANWFKPLPPLLAGLSDNGYGKDECLLFVEDKGHGDELRPKQITFMDIVNGLNIPGVRYVVAESEEDYLHYSLIGEQNG